MQKPPIKYVAIICMDFIKRDTFSKTRSYLLSNIAEAGATINKYALVGDINVPYGCLFLLPINDENTLERVLEQLKDVGGTSVYSMVASDTIVGRLCYRQYDNAYSSQQRILEEEYKKRPAVKVGYFESTRAKKPPGKLDIRGMPVENN